MPRSSSGGRSSGGGRSSFFSPGRSSFFSPRPRPRPAASTTSHKAPPPKPAAPAPPPAPKQAGSPTGGIGAAIVDGMAWGGGNAIAHRAVDAIAGPRTIRYETVASPAPAADSTAMATSSSLGGSDTCGVQIKAFQDCLNTSENDISKCQFYMDMLCECRKNSGAGLAA